MTGLVALHCGFFFEKNVGLIKKIMISFQYFTPRLFKN